MAELKPCPFCGEPEPIMRVHTDPHDLIETFSFQCRNELCFCEMGSARRKEWAIKRWNRRTDDEKS